MNTFPGYSAVRWFIYVSLFGLCALGLAFGSYYLWVFSKDATKIDRVLEAASIEDRNPPKFVVAVFFEGRMSSEVSGYVERHFYFDSNPHRRRGSVASWIERLAWWALFRARYGREEISALFCTIAWNGRGYGLEDLTMRLFEKPPSQTKREQLAFALAVFRSPSLLEKEPRKLEILAQEILDGISAVQDDSVLSGSP